MRPGWGTCAWATLSGWAGERGTGVSELEVSGAASVEEQFEQLGGSSSEFLVQMENRLPADFPPDRRAELVAAEAVRARELAEAGILVRLWRVTGRRANVGIWRAPTCGTLHEALESLPLFPWLEIQVTPVSAHPNDPELSVLPPNAVP
jgi:muconolactone D-isomerase